MRQKTFQKTFQGLERIAKNFDRSFRLERSLERWNDLPFFAAKSITYNKSTVERFRYERGL